MRKKEQRLWDRMRKACGDEVRLERIENLVSTGITDVIALGRGRVTMCELKAVDVAPKRATTRVFGGEGLSQEQKNWHLGWQRNGGRSIIVAAVGLDLYVLDGAHHDYFNDYTMEQLERSALARNWPDLIKYLKGIE